MKDLIACDKPTISALAERLKRANSHSEYQRIQCVLIRATLGSSAAEIAQLPQATQDIINTSGVDFVVQQRNIDRLRYEGLELLVRYPRLIQRPILVREDKAIIGRPKDRIAPFLNGE